MAKQTTKLGFLCGTSQGAWWLWTPAFTFDSVHSQVQSLLYLLYDKVLKCHPLGRPNPGKCTLTSAAFPSLPAHWKPSAGSASSNDEVSCQHPQAAHLALALRLTERMGAAIIPVSQIFPSLKCDAPSRAPSFMKVFARSLPTHTAHAILY